MIADALSYPLRGSGRTLIVIGALLSAVLDFAAGVPSLGFAARTLGGAYFVAYYFDIIATTVSGRETPPDFPEVTDLYGDILAPLIRALGALFIALLPFILVAGTHRGVALPLFEKWLSLAFAACYFPMAILNVAVGNDATGALPHRVIPDVIRAMPGYLLLVLWLLIMMLVSELGDFVSGRIPWIGSVLGAGISLYFIMVQARMAGMFYIDSLEEEESDADAGTSSGDGSMGE